MYLSSFDKYRGLAILLIVSAHCYSIAGVKIDTLPERIFANLTAGSTIHFIFISGFLFHHIFYRKQRIGTFFLAKVKRLLIPYTILSIAPIILKIKSEPKFWHDYLPLADGSMLNEYIIPGLLYYVTGAHLIAYWYIPFAICLFLLTPLHVRFIESKPRNQFLILGLLYFIALLVHRPISELNVFQSVVYFTPPYLLGVICSIKKNYIYNKLRGKEFLFLLIAVGLAIIQALLGRHDNYQKFIFVYDGFDLVLIQKSILCIFFMVFLSRYEHRKSKVLKLLAATSFSVYFIHGYVLRLFTLIKYHFEIKITHHWRTYFLVWGALVIFSICLASILKKIFPKYSKYLTGY